jgi:glycosyltransferase involved in cell wall biosynthesis
MNTKPKFNHTVAVFIHALNEEINIKNALQSVNDKIFNVFVIDAGSTDRTKQIAQESGAQVVEIHGDRSTLREQRVWALTNINHTCDWTFILDADEVVTPELLNRIKTIIRCQCDGSDGYWIPHRDIVFHKWLPRTSEYPIYTLRLFKTGTGAYQNRIANSHLVIKTGNTEYLVEPIIHNDARGIKGRINRLSSATYLEYKSLEVDKKSLNVDYISLLSRDPRTRRNTLKKIYYKLPARWLMIFIYLYLVRLGFLEGKAGFYNCCLRVFHELSINMYQFENHERQS